jgi:hypothetical protein
MAGLKKPMPNKTSFVYDIGTGEKTRSQTKVHKGGDLRARASKNNGK